jgi:membrane protein YqaA with SNARE-associated domain
MKIFAHLYEKLMKWSRHPHAVWYLGAVSFAESSFFPIPPDFMLAPMALSQPTRAWRFALITTITSILGAILGYSLGYLFFTLIHPLIIHLGYEPAYQKAVLWFNHWGFLAVFLVNFTPFPYKIFTIAAGALAMPILPFVFASFCGRGIRFFTVATLMRLGGKKLEHFLLRHIELLAWLSMLAISLLIAVIYYFHIHQV